MTIIRRNVWELGGTWAEPILWYARAVQAMKKRPLDHPTSWRFYAAIHGFDEGFWREVGYLDNNDVLPSDALQKQYWLQCQHGTWYFLPWHRGYLLAFEAVVRAEIVKLGGPADWALPYWNYFKPRESALPKAFASRSWPDGPRDNPLFVEHRYGPRDDGNVVISSRFVNLDALREDEFAGTTTAPEFGGVDTGFEHGEHNIVPGHLEGQPHNVVHGLVGGPNPRRPGLMSYPETAALDPIFWLHHANIDRLWEVWRRDPSATHSDPAEEKWRKGPGSFGERAFALPKPDGSGWPFTPDDVSELSKLDYTYDDLTPVGSPARRERLRRLGVDFETLRIDREQPMASNKRVEMVGASRGPVTVVGSEASTSVHFDHAARARVMASLDGAEMAAAPRSPDRVFLRLENVRSTADGTILQVYINLPEDADPDDHPECLAGTVSLFGARKATVSEEERSGISPVIEITDVIDRLHLNDALTADALHIRIIPLLPVPDDAAVQIANIAIFRQGE
ncbi:MAG TPA: tyrosinase family protein [Thermoanaerobaculia bacterium]|jgi:tyrosinase